MNIQWFPGHMAKTRRLISENLQMVDVVVELLDARIPFSSRNPEIDQLLGQKPRVVALNKADLADEKVMRQWKAWFAAQGIEAVPVDCMKGTGITTLRNQIKEACKEKIERQKARGLLNRPVRTMVVGIPNVGKSSFINRVAGRAAAVTGDRPGVTRGKQWIRLQQDIELLDMPGILWPKFDSEEVGLNLAWTGAIKDDIMDQVTLASRLIETLKIIYPKELSARYKFESLDADGRTLLKEAGKRRGCIISGGEIDETRISAIMLDELRGGRIGKLSLETPESVLNYQKSENI